MIGGVLRVFPGGFFSLLFFWSFVPLGDCCVGRCLGFSPSFKCFLCLFVVLFVDGSCGGVIFLQWLFFWGLSSPPVL